MGKTLRAASSNALGQLYGYGIQEARFLYYLLQSSSGDSIALEYLDDISGTRRGKEFAEQDKSGLAHNPISDRAVDLWKTFAKWIEGRRSGKIPPGTKFILYVAQPYRGHIAEQLSDCVTAQDATIALQTIRDEFWGDKPGYEKRALLPKSLAKYVNVVLAAKEKAVVDIVCSFTLERGSGAPYDDIAVEIANGPVGSENVQHIVQQLAGWIRTTIFKQIAKGEPAVLTRDAFQQQYIAAVRKFDRSDTSLNSFAEQPTSEQVEFELLNQNYIQQLRLIGAEDDLIYDAINTFLMAATDRTEWAKRGYVHRSSFLDYENVLRRTWTLKKASAKASLPKDTTPESLGTFLLAECLSATVPLQEKAVTSYFTPGSFHKMANTLDIGWHPDFATLLSSVRERADAA